MMWRRGVTLIIAASGLLELAACDDASEMPTENERATAKRIVKVWDVRFEPDADSASRDTTLEKVRRVEGQIAFVFNRRYRGRTSGEPADFGSYSIDFAPLGFYLDDESVPVALAWSVSADSAEILLGSPSGNRVVIRADVTDRALRGRWYLQLQRGMGTSGRFEGVPQGGAQH